MNGPKALSVLVSVLGAEKVVGKRKKVFADGSPAKSKIDGFSAKSKVCYVLCKKVVLLLCYWLFVIWWFDGNCQFSLIMYTKWQCWLKKRQRSVLAIYNLHALLYELAR